MGDREKYILAQREFYLDIFGGEISIPHELFLKLAKIYRMHVARIVFHKAILKKVISNLSN